MDARLFSIELRRNVALPLLPVLAALVCLSPIARHLQPVALWPDRSTDLQSVLQAFGPFFAGAAAWMAGRERRRGMDDLVATTPHSLWLRSMVTWATTACWGLLLYLLVGGVVFGVTAAQATWGGLVLGPPLVGLLALLALSAIGYAVGNRFPGRFTPPLVVAGLFALCNLGMVAALHGHALGYLTPLYPGIGISAAVWYAPRPDLSIIQALWFLGLTGVALGSLGLDRWRVAPSALRAAGLASVLSAVLMVTSVGLVLTTRADDARGVRLPLFQPAAARTMVAYTPVCSHDALPVCVHPAYRRELSMIATLINQIAAPLVGIPGAPTRAEQEPSEVGVQHIGAAPVLVFGDFILHPPDWPAGFQEAFDSRIALELVRDGPAASASPVGPAQAAVALFLLRRAGVPFAPDWFQLTPDVTAASDRLLALAPTPRAQWLRRHYATLRLGDITLEELP